MRVYVSPLLPVFSSTAQRNITFYEFGNIYDIRVPCIKLVPPMAAPSGYCMNAIHPKDIGYIIGSEWWPPYRSDLIQRYAKVVNPLYDDTYDKEMKAYITQHGTPKYFYDQFALERVCLAKWNTVPQVEDKAHADVIIVPSLLDHFVRLRWRDNLSWNLLLPEGCVPRDKKVLMKPAYCYQSFGNQAVHRRYWSLIRKTYFAPFQISGRSPLIIMHHSFTFDNAPFRLILKTLSEQPKEFRKRVVIATIESNQKKGIYYIAHGPSFITLPYPSGLRKPVLFGHSGQNTEDRYNKPGPPHPRPMFITLDANLNRKGGGGHIEMNWIRKLVHQHLVKKGASCFGSICVLCPPTQTNERGEGSCLNQWPLLKKNKITMWEALVSSTFCLEPAGDTLTRSHMYWALSSGCIPVLFDGGLSDYDDNETTQWAFRSGSAVSADDHKSSDINATWKLDYDSFAIIYKASDIQAGTIDFVSDLTMMALQKPNRLASLQKGVDFASAAMHFSAPSVFNTPSEARTLDAFGRFYAILQHATTLQ